ncbi:hypothetical protein P691DRAFT_789264 [Macrolepiota fuliginosa MF-IS2]|uniref:Nephrocystin 3-like N-terminal domain-containing protein n=1 Tax=Macrolepiota fuliginosa MF-IS2 TaxID=1400762 RepID=A0A9P6BYJ4_9AGAR|nr:hypothetical protein P691DRAFT_789264 [Macrolepiota fuliginosa MF-IS2]
MIFFSNSQNTTINNGNFTDVSIGVINNNVSLGNKQEGIDTLLQLASNADAAYDSSVRHPPPSCFPGTRVQYIEDITDWAIPTIDTDAPLPLYWMKGPAGVGKSAVAQTCVEKLKELGKLGAAFFFAVNGRDKAAQFFPSIIYQLSTEFPDYRDLVDQRTLRDRTVLSKTMMTQLRELVIEPLQVLEKNGRGIGTRVPIFIDGPDQCEDADAQCEIIRVIASAARNGSLPFCWAFFSRPEPHIEATFAITDIAQITSKTLLPISSDADEEIELYLRAGFENILRRPTALRVVTHSSSLPEQSLRIILDNISSHGRNSTVDGVTISPFPELDAFYGMIMQRCPAEALPKLLLSLVVMTNLGIGVLLEGNILALSELESKAVFSTLSAVLYFRDQPEPLTYGTADTGRSFQHADPQVIREFGLRVQARVGGSLHFYHKLFLEFLHDPTRSGRFCLSSPATLNAVFKHCIEHQLKCQRAYCFQGSDSAPAPDSPDSASSLSYPYTNELVNSIVKGKVLEKLDEMCLDSVAFLKPDTQLLQQFQYIGFRKGLQVGISLYVGFTLTSLVPYWVSGLYGHARFFRGGIRLFRLLPGRFSKFNLTKFKTMIEQMQQAGIIRPYHHNLTSRLRSFIPRKPEDRSISGLYQMGHGPKSIFWY